MYMTIFILIYNFVSSCFCGQITYNVVVASYALSEIPKTSLRQMAVRSLWGKTSDFLVSFWQTQQFRIFCTFWQFKTLPCEQKNVSTFLLVFVNFCWDLYYYFTGSCFFRSYIVPSNSNWTVIFHEQVQIMW